MAQLIWAGNLDFGYVTYLDHFTGRCILQIYDNNTMRMDDDLANKEILTYTIPKMKSIDGYHSYDKYWKCTSKSNGQSLSPGTSYNSSGIKSLIENTGVRQVISGCEYWVSTYNVSWTNIYTITFNANSGYVSTSSKTQTYNATWGDLPTPTKSGYTFDGWFTAASGGTQITATSKVVDDITVYAHWTKIPETIYTITFDANGGSGAPSPITYGKSGEFKIPSQKPIRNHYAFMNWNTTKADNGVRFISGGTYFAQNYQRDFYLYAIWVELKRTITFDLNGGIGTVPGSISEVYSKPITLPYPTGIIKQGYLTTGWNSQNNGKGTHYDFNKSYNFDASTKLYLEWQIDESQITYKIEYNLNGGTGNIEPTVYKRNQTNIILTSLQPTPPTGKYFKCWNTNKLGTETNYAPGQEYFGNKTSDITLYAIYETITYTCKFYNYYGGSVIDTIRFNYGDESFTISTTNPKRTGYEFLGWSENPKSTIPTYKYGDKLFLSNSNMILYGVWKDISGPDIDNLTKYMPESIYGQHIAKPVPDSEFDKDFTNPYLLRRVDPQPPEHGELFPRDYQLGIYTLRSYRGVTQYFHDEDSTTDEIP